MTKTQKIESLLECYYDGHAAANDLRKNGMFVQADSCEQTAIEALSRAEELGYVFTDEFASGV